MAKVTLNDLSNLQNEQSAVTAINQNNARLEAAIENTLSRDGAAPNEMNAPLDMNNNRIYNLPKPIGPSEPVRREDIGNIFDLYDNLAEALGEAEQSAANSEASAVRAEEAEVGALAAQQAAEDAAASVSGAFVNVPTIAAAEATNVPPSTDYLIVGGQTTAGVGGGRYVRLSVPPVPVEAWHFQSADGAYWALSELSPNADQFGVVKNGVADDTVALQTMVNYASSIGGATCYIPPGTYKISKVSVKSNVSIECSEQTVFESIAAAGDHCFEWVGVTSGSSYLLTAAPSPAWNGTTLTLSPSDAANFTSGDRAILRDNTFISSPYGRNQEFVEIESVSSGTITLKSSVVGTYTTGNSAQLIKFIPVVNSHFSGGRINVPLSKVSTTISTTSGSPTATVASAAGLSIGMVVETTNVTPTPSNCTITNIVGTTITLSGNAAGTGSGVAATFHRPTGGGFLFRMAIDCSLRRAKVRNVSGLPAVSVYQSRNVLVDSNDFRYGQALSIAGFGYGIDIDDSSSWITATKNHTESLRENVISNRSSHVLVSANTCLGMLYNGWNTHAAGCSHITFSNNIVTGTRNGSGIAVGYTSGYTNDSTVVITGNIIRNSNEAGIQVAGGTSYTGNGVVITSNIISGYGKNSASSFKNGIFVYKTNQVIISDNLIQDGSSNSGTVAIVLDTSVVCKVNDNIIEGVFGQGVTMASCAFAHIDMNHFRSVSGNNINAASSNSASTVRFNRADTTTVSIDAAVSQTGNSWN